MTRSSILGYERNVFAATMIGLDCSGFPQGERDLFSRTCVEQYETADFGNFGYLFAQVFEEHVLKEIAALERLAYPDLAGLAHAPTSAAEQLVAMVSECAGAPAVTQIGIAACLISISRFSLARDVLGAALLRAATARERFEAAMLDFVVTNRCEDGRGASAAFSRMRAAIEEGGVPPTRAIQACSQAVVWYAKAKHQVAPADHAWFVSCGSRIISKTPSMDPGAVSAWYRAVAMLPAAVGDAKNTREFMLKSQAAAQESIRRRPRPYEMHFLKTYYESAIKEHMHVTKNFDRAIEAGERLIEIDPVWAPSYGELAEVHVRLGKYDRAASLFAKAARLGPPYVGHHLFCAAQCLKAAGDCEAALDVLLELAEFAPDNTSVAELGFKVADGVKHPMRALFASRLARLQ